MPSIPYCRAKRQFSLYWINTNSLQLYKMIADIDPDGVPGEAATLLAALQPELRREEQIDSGSANEAATVDEIYTRTQYVADGFHFGQTIGDDFGRPYGRGFQHSAALKHEARAEDWRRNHPSCRKGFYFVKLSTGSSYIMMPAVAVASK